MVPSRTAGTILFNVIGDCSYVVRGQQESTQEILARFAAERTFFVYDRGMNGRWNRYYEFEDTDPEVIDEIVEETLIKQK